MVVTCGELNTLPDYMANPTVLDAQPRNILLPILQAVRQEGYNKINGMLGHSSPTSFKDAVAINTGWSFIDLLLETKSIDDLTWNLGPNHTNHYLGLVARNACHFAPFSWYLWEEYYTIARNLARQAYQDYLAFLDSTFVRPLREFSTTTSTPTPSGSRHRPTRHPIRSGVRTRCSTVVME